MNNNFRAQDEDHTNVEQLPVVLKPALVIKSNDATESGSKEDTTPLRNNVDFTGLSKRTPVSRRLLAKNNPSTTASATPSVTFVSLSTGPVPSIKREEATALANLRKKIAPILLVRPDREARRLLLEANNEDEKEGTDRVHQKKSVMATKPMYMVVQWNDICTAWQDSDFITECLCWHNVYRQRHGAPVLAKADELCDLAQNWANHLSHTNKFSYKNDRSVGQNLYQRPVGSIECDVTGQEVSSYWYANARQYNFYKEPDVLHANVNSGQFTQMVWVSTRFFGVGKARSRAGKVIVVAVYSPPGNKTGRFESNVLPALPDNMPESIF